MRSDSHDAGTQSGKARVSAPPTSHRDFAVVDRSFLKSLLRRYHFALILGLIPSGVSPVAITLVGLFACLAIPIAVASGYNGKTTWFGWMCAGAVYVYMVADHLDGMQARRSGSGTRLGALLDHLCDFFNGCFIVLGACAAAGTDRTTLIVMTILFVTAFTLSHLEVVVRRELWLGDGLWLGTHTPLEGLLIIATYFIIGRLIGQWYWLFVAYFSYKFLAVIVSARRRMGRRIRPHYWEFCAGFVATLLPASIEDGLQALLFWLLSVLYSGTYLFELLAADPGVVPRPRRWPLTIIGLAFVFAASDSGRASVEILGAVAFAQAANLVLKVRAFAAVRQI